MLEKIGMRTLRGWNKDRAPSRGAVLMFILIALCLSVLSGPAQAKDFQITTGASYVSVDSIGLGRCTIPLTYIPGSVRGVAARRGDWYHVWIASGGPGYVYAADNYGGMTGSFPVLSSAGDPTDIAVDVSSIWVCTDGIMICEYSPEGSLLGSFPATGGVTPAGIALTPTDTTVWVLDEAGVLSEYTRAGEFRRNHSVASMCVRPAGLDINWETGDFWVVDDVQNCVCLFDSLCQPLGIVNITGCAGLTGVCCGDLLDPCELTGARPGPLTTIPILSQNHPNPFSPVTEIEYFLPVDRHVVLIIYNATGRRIITLVDEYQKAGKRVVCWNGLGRNGVPLPAGSYFCRLTAGGRTESIKMALIR